MILTCDSRSSGRATCPSATWSTTDTGWNDMGSKPHLRGERLANFVFSITARNKNTIQSFQMPLVPLIFICLILHLHLPLSFAETLN
jgi:hypothetical protein